jgi:hypothetical protein
MVQAKGSFQELQAGLQMDSLHPSNEQNTSHPLSDAFNPLVNFGAHLREEMTEDEPKIC